MRLSVSIFLLLILSIHACSRGELPVSDPPIVSTIAVLPTETVVFTQEVLPSNWQGIPILPDALTGEGDGEGYVFTARSTLEQVRMFYETELPGLGWDSMPTEDVSTMIFVKNDETLTINVFAKEGEVLVLLTK